MNGGPVPVTVSGDVQRLDCTGIGPNSGEITIVLLPEGGGKIVEVFAGINPSSNGNEQGVYASYVSIALSAMATGRKLACTYQVRDKARITGMTILK
jgi:hypothetical protein